MTKRNLKKGFSLVEVVIALSVITVVTVTALSLTLSSVVARTTSLNKSYAQGFASDVIECFKAADGEEQFVDLVTFATGANLQGEENSDLTDNKIHVTRKFDDRNFKAIIEVDYTTARPTLTITVNEADSEDEIIVLEYKRGSLV